MIGVYVFEDERQKVCLVFQTMNLAKFIVNAICNARFYSKKANRQNAKHDYFLNNHVTTTMCRQVFVSDSKSEAYKIAKDELIKQRLRKGWKCLNPGKMQTVNTEMSDRQKSAIGSANRIVPLEHHADICQAFEHLKRIGIKPSEFNNMVAKNYMRVYDDGTVGPVTQNAIHYIIQKHRPDLLSHNSVWGKPKKHQRMTVLKSEAQDCPVLSIRPREPK